VGKEETPSRKLGRRKGEKKTCFRKKPEELAAEGKKKKTRNRTHPETGGNRMAHKPSGRAEKKKMLPSKNPEKAFLWTGKKCPPGRSMSVAGGWGGMRSLSEEKKGCRTTRSCLWGEEKKKFFSLYRGEKGKKGLPLVLGRTCFCRRELDDPSGGGGHHRKNWSFFGVYYIQKFVPTTVHIRKTCPGEKFSNSREGCQNGSYRVLPASKGGFIDW